jgi:hypothetical protein
LTIDAYFDDPLEYFRKNWMYFPVDCGVLLMPGFDLFVLDDDVMVMCCL